MRQVLNLGTYRFAEAWEGEHGRRYVRIIVRPRLASWVPQGAEGSAVHAPRLRMPLRCCLACAAWPCECVLRTCMNQLGKMGAANLLFSCTSLFRGAIERVRQASSTMWEPTRSTSWTSWRCAHCVSTMSAPLAVLQHDERPSSAEQEESAGQLQGTILALGAGLPPSHFPGGLCGMRCT